MSGNGCMLGISDGRRFDMKDLETCPVGTMDLVLQLNEEKNELYDMLLYTLTEMDYNPILEADIQDVLTKVNKEK